MKKIFSRFTHDRRGVIGVLFAASLLPLVMLIGLSIDYSFYVQARSQFALAGDAAATYALREASAVYEAEVGSSTISNSTSAAAIADAAGETSGAAWFTGQLGTLPTAYISGGSPTVTLSANTEASADDPQGFTATVSWTGIYPPFFNRLFQNRNNWTVTGTSGATSQFSYVELLILIDDSSSMLVSADQGLGTNNYGTADGNPVSATDPGTVGTMDINTACTKTSYNLNGPSDNGTGAYTDPGGFINVSDVQNKKSGTSIAGIKCASGYSGPYAPCAFACHVAGASTYSAPGFTYTGGSSTQLVSKTTNVTYPADLYGLARQLGVQLKLDVVLQSTETIIQAMINGDLAPDQFSVGVYGFNNDACPIVNGATLGNGNYATGGGINLTEATTTLSSALSAVEAIDYTYTPTETTFPPTASDANGGTNFPLSVADLMAGNMTSTAPSSFNTPNCTTTGNQAPLATPPSTGTVGATPTNPEKDIFIITDGMEDQRSGTPSTGRSSGTTCGRVLGEMTGITAEANLTPSACAQAVCQPLKKLGFTIYVLQTTYPAVQNTFYYDTNPSSDQYINTDFSNVANPPNNGTAEEWNTGYQTTGPGSSTNTNYSPATTLYDSPAPNEQALQACASPGDYYQASSSSAISTAMNDMLKSALSAAVRITE